MSASNASTSEDNASTSESNALSYKNDAETSASNASTSESNASTSESNASTSETNALASENKAEQWAEEVEDTEVGTGKYSALHHKEKALAAQEAAEIAQGFTEGARDLALIYKNDAEAALISILDYRGGIPI